MYSFKNYYSILNVSETAPYDEIKAVFRRMAKLYSPDVNPDPSVTHRFEEILFRHCKHSRPAIQRTGYRSFPPK